MSLYQELVSAGCKMDHHESDLYVAASERSRSIIAKYPKIHTAGEFRSEGIWWIEVPFMYEPFWEAKQAQEVCHD